MSGSRSNGPRQRNLSWSVCAGSSDRIFELRAVVVPAENAKLGEAAEFFVLDKMRERNRAVVFFPVSGNEKQMALACHACRISEFPGEVRHY